MLILYNFVQNPAQKNEAHAYIFYGTNKEPQNHHGHKIDTLHDPRKRANYELHLTDHIIPALNKKLNENGYKIDRLGHTGEKPYLLIWRNDRRKLSPGDLRVLRGKISSFIREWNKANKTGKKRKSHFQAKHVFFRLETGMPPRKQIRQQIDELAKPIQQHI